MQKRGELSWGLYLYYKISIRRQKRKGNGAIIAKKNRRLRLEVNFRLSPEQIKGKFRITTVSSSSNL